MLDRHLQQAPGDGLRPLRLVVQDHLRRRGVARVDDAGRVRALGVFESASDGAKQSSRPETLDRPRDSPLTHVAKGMIWLISCFFTSRLRKGLLTQSPNYLPLELESDDNLKVVPPRRQNLCRTEL